MLLLITCLMYKSLPDISFMYLMFECLLDRDKDKREF